MEFVRERDVNTSFRNSLSFALEQLQLTVLTEFEIALRKTNGFQKVKSEADNVIQSPIRKVPWHYPASEPARCARLPPKLGSPIDTEQEAALASEDWPLQAHALETSMGPWSIDLSIDEDEEDLDQLPNKSERPKITTSEKTLFSDVLNERAQMCNDYRAPLQSGGAQMLVSQDFSGKADESQLNDADTNFGSSEHECGQSFLKISPFWMGLVAEGLHKTQLDTINAKDLLQAKTVQQALVGRGNTLAVETGLNSTFSCFSKVSPHQRIFWPIWKLRLDDTKSCGFKLLRPLILSPDAKFRILWSFLSLLFLMYDGIMIPVDECFRSTKGDSESILHLQLPMQIFWTADILVSFLSAYSRDGFLEMSPGAVVENYIKSWLVFDTGLVSVEWYFIGQSTDVSFVSLLRNLRAFRIFRVVRLMRFARLWKTMPFIKRYLVLTSRGMSASFMLLMVVFVCFLYAHIGACLWHLVGQTLDAGWISTNGMQNYSLLQRYVISLHYLFIRLQGSSSHVIMVHDPIEILVDTVIIFLSLLLTSVLMSVFSQALVAWIRSDAARVKTLSKAYLQRHAISPETRQRVSNYLQANQLLGSGEVLMGEDKFISAMPANMQEELHFEARHPMMCRNTFFSFIVSFCSQCVRVVCQKAVSDLLAVGGEVVFHEGDQSLGDVYMLRSGVLLYKCDEEILQQTPRSDNNRPVVVREGCEVVRRGALISEVSLFVSHWRHVGDLVPQRDVILLVLHIRKFTKIVSSYRIASIVALKYARHFVWCLNRSVQCDLSSFDFSVEKLDDELVSGKAEDHYAFISHYKVESGTEATLLRDLMEQKIREDQNNKASDFLSPVFIDSEDLVDLARLEQHVLGSSNLVILLTPGILTRPWCLLEITVAFQNDVQLVPVEVQRPGMRYQYPNDDWHKEFCDGKILQHADEELLRGKGYPLETVGEAVRHLFTKISLPFSPHKSGNVRNAEIEDLMKRCHDCMAASTLDTAAMRSMNEKNPSSNSSPLALFPKPPSQKKIGPSANN